MNWKPQIAPLLVAVTLVYSTVLLLQANPIESFTRSLSDTEVSPNQTVQMRVESVRTMSGCDSQSTRVWVDSNGTVIQSSVENNPPREKGFFTRTRDIIIPTMAKPGVLVLKTKNEFYCNWLQKWTGYGSWLVTPDTVFNVKEN